MYGPKQSSRQWNKHFHKLIAGIDFEHSEHDTRVYFKFLVEYHFIVLMLCIGDILLAKKSMSKVDKTNFELNNKFDVKDLGVARIILGIEITRQCDLKCLHVS